MEIIMIISCIAMLIINVFAINISSIAFMMMAALVSLVFFMIKGAPDQKKGGAKE